MTVIRPNSVSGITSITAQANEINVFRSNGLLAGLNLNGVNFNTTAGISTLAALKVTGNLDVEGVLTYQDVTNVDSIGIVTARAGVNVSGGQLDVGSNIKLGNAGVITATSFVGDGGSLTGVLSNIVEDTSPQLGANLDVNGANILFGDSSAAGTNLNRLKFGTHTDLHIWHNSGTGNSNISNYNGNLYIQGNNGSGTGVNQIAILSNAAVELNYQGNKKLETTTSGITVTGSAAITGAATLGNGSGLNFGDTSARIIGESGSSGLLRFDVNGGEKVRISSTGYVGVGTLGHTSPTAPLSVNLGIAANNGNYFLDVKGSSTKQFGLYYDQGSWGSAEFGIHEFDNSGNASKRFTIANGGKIGINNDSPDDTLDVNGTAEITSNTYIGGNLYMYGNSYGNGIFLGGSNAVHKLDYYKTGQWVPEVIDANGSNYSIAYTATECRWVRIGHLVYAYYNIQNQENGSKTGDLVLRGFPFTVRVFQAGGQFWVDHSSPSSGLGDIVGGTHRIAHSGGYNTIYWVKPTDKSGMGYASSRYLEHGQWSYGRWIYGSFMYEIS